VRKNLKESCGESKSDHPANSLVTKETILALILQPQTSFILFVYLQFISRHCQCVRPCRQRISELEKVWKAAVVALLEVLLCHIYGGIKKTTKNLSPSEVRDSKQVPHECEAEGHRMDSDVPSKSYLYIKLVHDKIKVST
jgi:hypothetical protein